MAKRMSNKARIQEKASEAAAAQAKEAEKAAKPDAPKKKSAKKPAAGRQLKLVWKVFNSSFKEVGCFPYADKTKAYEMAEKLEKKDGSTHFVNAVTV